MRNSRRLCLSILRCVAQSPELADGLAEDPDILDPTPARTFVGRLVFAALCDKLFDLDEKLNVVPMLATSYEWSADSKALTLKLRQGVTFHDGEKLDAAAVKFNLERHKNLPGSSRRAELAPVRASTWWMRKRCASTSPRRRAAAHRAHRPRRNDGLAEGGAGGADKFGAHPVCSGPFRFVERIAQDRIVARAPPGLLGQEPHSISSASSTCRSSTRPCASPTCAPASSISSSAWRPPTSRPEGRRPLQDREGRSSSATRASTSTSARAISPRRTRSGAIRACARRSSSRSTGKASCRSRRTARPWSEINGSRRATPITSRNTRCPNATWRERARCSRRRACQSDREHDDANDLGCAAHRAGGAGDGEGGGLSMSASNRPSSRPRSARATRASTRPFVLAWSGRADPDGNLQNQPRLRRPAHYSGYCNKSVDEAMAQARAQSDPRSARKSTSASREQVLKDRPIV